MEAPCPPASDVRVIEGAGLQRPAPGSSNPAAPGFSDRLATTSFGLPSLPVWCLWVEPLPEPTDLWSQRWTTAVESAISTWSSVLDIQRVDDPARAQIVVWRRRPPRRNTPSGWRASNGRSTLSIRELERSGRRRREPFVTVLVSPGLRASALESTALHELGHAFGLWGHSPDPSDAMAPFQPADPILTPSVVDRRTLQWVRSQANKFGPIPRDDQSRLGAPRREARTD